jgi:hypothetical protein
VLRFLKIILFVSFFALVAAVSFAEREDVDIKSQHRKKFEEYYKKYAKEKNQEILFYGQVVDFSKKPIGDAKLSFSVRFYPSSPYAHDFRHEEVLTDETGNFVVESYGELLTLDGIKKGGYQYRYEYNSSRSFNFSRNLKRKGSGFELTKPKIFKIRKKSPPAFVLIGNWNFALHDEEAKLLDLYRRDWTSPDRLSGKKFNYHDWETDLKVSVEKKGENFQMIMEAVKDDSGFVVTTPEFIEEMTEAPEHGYRPKLMVPITKNSGGRLFAYVKNEGGLFYSKIYINYANRADRDHVELNWGYFTNVAGERGLEFVPELAQQYRNDARDGHRPRLKREQLRAGSVVTPVLGAE